MKLVVLVGLLVAVVCVIEARKHKFHDKRWIKVSRGFHADSKPLSNTFHKGLKHDGRMSMRGKHLHLKEVS